MGGRNLDQFNSRQQAKAKKLKDAKDASPKNPDNEEALSKRPGTSLHATSD
jgi:hypothetical protein